MKGYCCAGCRKALTPGEEVMAITEMCMRPDGVGYPIEIVYCGRCAPVNAHRLNLPRGL